MRICFRWPFVRRRCFDALFAELMQCHGIACDLATRISAFEAEIARLKNSPDVAQTHLRNLISEVRSVRDKLDRVLSWKGPE